MADGGWSAPSANPDRRTALAWMSASALGLATAGQGAEMGEEHPVVELRQYKIVRGQRDRMIALFEREFVETQEAVGIRLIGQFRDLDDPDRFTWIRTFPTMAERERALNAFYFGPVWQAHREEANPMLEDNDNVLLLRAADAGFDFAAQARANLDAPAGLVVATIHYLWKTPQEGFTAFFRERLQPALSAAGLPPIAAFVPEGAPNNFPRLPVRQGEKLFVWFSRAADQADHDRRLAALRATSDWTSVAAVLEDFEERPAQVLRLSPTRRSRLR
jgi:hypothetical protein